MIRFGMFLRALLPLALCTTLAQAQVMDQIFAGGFSNPADGPFNDAEAARFLTQATFGATKAEIARLRRIGYRAWLDEQIALPPSTTLTWLDQLAANPNFSLNSGHRVDRWYVNATSAQDQLRQKMSYALSQIIVVSDSGGIDTRKIADYADQLNTNAFGTYRQVLGLATFHPAMGEWLTYIRNRKQFTSSGAAVLPDENYAREVMQLFSFGLVKRNLDFSLTGGTAQPTYDNTIIASLARVFTGLSYANSPSFYSTTINGNPLVANQLAPLWCFPMNLPSSTGYLATGTTYHDLTAKTIFDGVTLPAIATDTRQNCEAEINLALDRISEHATVAPYISRQLIQRFVSSNPSPAYIQRVATAFNNAGGTRGDLAVVIRAILLDDEARLPPSGNRGKLKEPVLRMTALWRGFDMQLGQPEPALNGNGTVNTNVGNINMTLGFANDFGQRPYSAPTVFNFYSPDFRNPGAIANANLYSPEFQILNESNVTRMNNLLRNRGIDWFVGASGMQPVWPLVQLDSLVPILNPVNATTYGSLVDELNYRMMDGQMSSFMRQTLITMLSAQTVPTTDAAKRDLARLTMRVIINSPEYAVQK